MSSMKTASQRSNRRVPAELLGGLDKDEPARGFIMEQDRDIAEKSGRPPLAIKSLTRTGAKKSKAVSKSRFYAREAATRPT